MSLKLKDVITNKGVGSDAINSLPAGEIDRRRRGLAIQRTLQSIREHYTVLELRSMHKESERASRFTSNHGHSVISAPSGPSPTAQTRGYLSVPGSAAAHH